MPSVSIQEHSGPLYGGAYVDSDFRYSLARGPTPRRGNYEDLKVACRDGLERMNLTRWTLDSGNGEVASVFRTGV
jgi:hypothetical protein